MDTSELVNCVLMCFYLLYVHDYVSSAHLLPTNAVVKCSLPNTGFFGVGTGYDGVRCGYIFLSLMASVIFCIAEL